MPYCKNNMVYLTFLLGFVFVNAVLFISRAIQYRESNWYTIFARACGKYFSKVVKTNNYCKFIRTVFKFQLCLHFGANAAQVHYLSAHKRIW